MTCRDVSRAATFALSSSSDILSLRRDESEVREPAQASHRRAQGDAAFYKRGFCLCPKLGSGGCSESMISCTEKSAAAITASAAP